MTYMTHYYIGHDYSPAQAVHANEVVLDLIRKHRFFLYSSPHGLDDSELDFTLDPITFREPIALNAELRELYVQTRKDAVARILDGEKHLGVVPASLEDNRQLVVANQYGGGFEICRVYPLQEFYRVTADNLTALRLEQVYMLMDGRPEDDFSVNQMREIKEEADTLAKRIWSELEELEMFDPKNRRCIVLMHSKVSCSDSERDGHFAYGRLRHLQQTPFATGYLLWKFSRKTRIVRHNFIVCSTSYKSHVCISHWQETQYSTKSLSANFDKQGGYSSPVMFATIL